MAIGAKQGGNFGPTANTYDPVVLADSFETWRVRTNKTLDAFVANTVTTSNTYFSNGAVTAITHGSFKLIGDVVASNVYINDGKLRGGQRGNPDTLTIGSNAIFQQAVTISNNATIGIDGEDEALFNARIRATSNAVFRDIVRLDANVYIGSSNADILQVNAISTFDSNATFNANTFFNANVSITENLSVTKEINVTGNGSVGGTFTVTGAGDFNNTLNVDGSTTLNGLTATTIAANSTVDLNSTLNVDGSTTLNGLTATTIAANSTLNVDGVSSLHGLTTTSITANGAVDLNSTLNVDGASTLNGLTTTTLTSNGAVDLNSTLNVDGNSTLNGLTATTITANSDVDIKGTLNVDGVTTFNELSITTLTANGTLTLNGNVTLGNATADDIVFTGRVASDINPKTDGTYNLGSNTLRWETVYADTITVGNTNIQSNLDVDGSSTLNQLTVTTLGANGAVDFNSTLNVDGSSTLNGLTTTTFTANGIATLNGAVTLGNATGDDLTFTGRAASSLVPKTDGVYSLGTNTLRWEQVYADDITAGNTSLGGTLSVDGTTTLNGAVTLGNATGDDLTFTGRAASSLVPKTDGVYSLGTNTLRWEQVYADDITAGNTALSGTLDVNGTATFNGNMTLGNAATDSVNITGEALLSSYKETKATTTTASSTLAVSLNSSMNHVVTLANNITSFSFTNVPASSSQLMGATLVLIQGTGGNKTITWPAGYKFQAGVTPVLSTSAGDIDVLTFFSYDGGSTWLGTIAGLDFS
jgi:cytoskeletal protein CcmA (bactofilin family)